MSRKTSPIQLSESLEHLQRHLARSWERGADSGGKRLPSHSEYEYLRAVDTLDNKWPTSLPDDAGDGHHISEVAAEMAVRKASASAMVQKLEKRGMLHRVACRYDARAQHVMLTDEGRALLNGGHEVYGRAAARIKEQLDPEEYRALERALAKVTAPDGAELRR